MLQAGVDKKDLDIALLRAQVDSQQRALQEMSADLREMRLGKILILLYRKKKKELNIVWIGTFQF